MRLPHQPSGSRFFARLRAAVLECPRCGTVISFGQGRRGSTDSAWDRRTSRLQCPDCGKVYLLGILAWPIKVGGGGWGKTRKGATIPTDQVPNERQLAQIRAEAWGIWMDEDQGKPRFRPEDTNVTKQETDEDV